MASEKVKGRKSNQIMIIFDEAESIDSNIWDATEKIFKENKDSSNWIKILSPINVSSKGDNE